MSGLDVLGFDVLLQGREGGLFAYCCYLGQETDTEIQLSASERHTEAREAATVSQRLLTDFCGRPGRAHEAVISFL